MKALRTSVAAFVFLISVFTFGQQELIDGSVTPNRIPDAIAYRIIFIALSNPSSVQQAQIDSIGFGSTDATAFTKLLATFYSKYQSLSDQYNNDVQVGNGDLTSFLSHRAGLVRDTRRAVTGQLSSAGTKLLDAFVQAEKLKMKTTETQ